LYDFQESNKTIILSYEDEIHFKLVGYYSDNRMIYFFEYNEIPEEILKITKIIR